LRTPVAIDEDGVIFLTEDGVLGKIAPEGRLRWSLLLAPSSGAPALDGGTGFVAGRDRRLYATDTKGNLLWSRPLWGVPIEGATIAPSVVAVAVDPGFVRFWDRDRRTLLGQIALGAMPSAAPSLGSDGLFFVPTRDGWLVALDSHAIRWRRRVATLALSPAAVAADSTIIVGSQTGTLSAVNPQGNVLWTEMLGVDPIERSPVLADDGTIYVIAGGHLVAVSRDGGVRWRNDLPGRIAAGPLVADDGSILVAVTSRDLVGQILAIAPDGASLRRHPLKGLPTRGMSLADHQLWVSLAESSLQRVTVPQRELARSPWAKARGGKANRGASATP
jgi:outer membrane protein assembly factor BamB